MNKLLVGHWCSRNCRNPNIFVPHVPHHHVSATALQMSLLEGVWVGACLHLYHYISVRQTLLPLLSYPIVLCSPAINPLENNLVSYPKLTMNNSTETQSQTHWRGQNNVPFFSFLFSVFWIPVCSKRCIFFPLQMDQPTDTIVHE